MKRIYCRACNACGLQEVLSLGSQPPANSLLEYSDDKEHYYPLRLVVCRSCYLLQLDHDVSHTELFNDGYPLYSGSVPGTVAKSKQYAEYMMKRFDLKPDSLVIEIGGNDGTLLKQFNTHRLNIEMSKGPANASASAGLPTMIARWGHYPFAHRADLIIANNVMAHDPDLQSFVEAIAEHLAPGGTFTAEFPWALRMIEQGQFDTIYHEHYSYFTLRALVPLFAAYGLNIYDVEELPDLHGGSLRIYAAKTGTREITKNVNELMHEEAPLSKLETYWKFRETALRIRSDFDTFIAKHVVYAYGAAAKGNTFINWLGLDNREIVAVGDSTPAKIGKYLPGSHILIISEEQLLANRPAYVLILPWNWAPQIADKLHCIRGWGGQFVTAIPELKVF